MSNPLERLTTALSDRYAIERELGSGGMAIVYLARDLKHDRFVALKVLRPEIALALGSERFLQEIQIAAKLNHPHILALHDSGEADGFLYYVMPHVEGETLRDKLNREKQLGVEDALRFTEQIASALDHAHGQAVIHRDIKPENILLHEGEAMVADFGIALAVSAAGGERLTETGLSVGTPEYMSPEQGSGGGEIDSRSDIYSLGCVVYEMFAGHPPFTGTTAPEILARHSLDPVPSLRAARAAVSAAVENALSKALGKTPEDRFASAGQFASALTRAEDLAPAGRRGLVVAAVAALVVAGVVGVLLRSSPASELDADLLAVAPFDILTSDPELQFWGEGFVDMLSRSLDGAGALRTVSPTVVIRRWQGRADLASAAALGRATGARLALYGSLIGAGSDSVRLAAAVLDVATEAVLAEFEFRETADRVDRVADSLTLAMLRELGRGRPGGRERLSAMGTTSLPAIKAFLKGEQFYRRANLDSAREYYETAVGVDTTFALAFGRLYRASWYLGVGPDPGLSVYAFAAGALNRGLAPRESLLLAADSLFASAMFPDTAGWETRGRRVLAILEDATRRYPDDPELWERLGDARVHFGFLTGATDRDALAALERSIALDPLFAPTYLNHPIELSLRLRGSGPALELARDYLALEPHGSGAGGVELFMTLVDSPAARGVDVQQVLDTTPDVPLSWALQQTMGWPDAAETAVRIARRLVANRRQSQSLNEPFLPFFASVLASRGHVREAYRLTDLPATAAALGLISPDSAAGAFRQRLAEGRRFLFGLPWWAATGDTGSIHQLLGRVDERFRPQWGESFTVYGRRAGQAFLALANGDSTRALRGFRTALGYPEDGEIPQRTALPDSVCPAFFCPFEGLELARLLMARGRDRDAAAVLDWLSPWTRPTLRPIIALERGRVHERLGNRDQAIEAYSFVLEAWRDPDPELLPMVEEARAALARLTAEPRR